MDVMLVKHTNGALQPATLEDKEKIGRLKVGQEIGCTFTQLRNGTYHRKLFSLLRFGFDNSERVTIDYNGQLIGQSFSSYRAGLVIRAGHHHIDIDNKGSLRYVAQSLEYAKCSQELAEEIYSNVIDVLIKDFAGTYTRKQLDDITSELLRYAA